MSEVLADFIELMVSGITNIATGVGQGLSTLVTNIFLEVNAETHAVTGLSAFGSVIAIFAGIGLAIGLSRLVVNFVTSLGRM